MAVDNEILLTIRAETDKATAEIKSLKKQIENISKTVKDNNGSFAGQEKAMKSIDSTASSLVKTLAGLATAYASIAGAKEFVSFMADIEEGFIGIAKTTGASEEQMKKFTDGLYEMTKALHGISLKELQGIAEGAGQLGIANKDILTFTESIAKISVATNLTAEEASTDFAVIANVFGEPIDNVEKLGSAVNELSATTAATVPQIVDGTKRLAGVGNAFGMSADQIMAFIATLADAGVRTEVGATALSDMFTRMQADVDKFAKASGVSVDEFANMLKTKPVEAVKLFATSLDKVNKSGGNTSQVLRDVGLTGSGTVQTVLALANNVDNLNKNLRTSNNAFKEGTSVQSEYDKASQSINSKMKDVQNAFVRLGKELTVTLQPVLKELLDLMVDFIDSIDSKAVAEFAQDIVDAGKAVGYFVAENKTLIKTLLEMGAVFISLQKAQKMMLGVFGESGLKVIASMTTSAGQLDKALILLTRRVIDFGKSLMALALSNPVIAGITLALGGLLYVYNKYNDSMDENHRATQETMQASKEYDSVMKELFQNIKENNGVMFDSVEAQDAFLKKISDVKDKNDELIKQYQAKDPEKYAEQIRVLNGANEVLAEATEKVKAVTKEEIEEHKKATEEVKRQALAKQELSDKDKEFVEKSRANAKKRYDNELATLQGMRIQNVKLYNDLEQLEAELSQTRLEYANRRKGIEDDYVSRVRNAYQKLMSEEERMQDDRLRMNEAYAKYKYEIEQGNTEQAKTYLEEYQNLSSRVLDEELTKYKDNIVLKRKAVDDFASREKQVMDEKIKMNDLDLQKEVSAHNEKINMKILEIENMKTQIKLQMESLKVMEQLVRASGNVKFKADLEPFKQSIKDADAQIELLSNKKRTANLTLNADVADAEGRINRLETIASEPVTKTVSADTGNAMRNVDSLVSNISNSDVELRTKANTDGAKKDVSKAIYDIETKDTSLSVHADTDRAVSALSKLTKPIDTKMRISIIGESTVQAKKRSLASPITSTFEILFDAYSISTAYNIRADLSRPIYTTQYIRTEYTSQNGGVVPRFATGGAVQRFATGGYPRRSGALGGYGGGDKIKALLEAGEFIQRKEAVRKYGVNFMYALNNLRIPKSVIDGIAGIQNVRRYQAGGAVAHFKEGGSVDGKSGLIQPINLNIGGESFGVMADEEVGNALKRLLKKSKGL